MKYTFFHVTCYDQGSWQTTETLNNLGSKGIHGEAVGSLTELMENAREWGLENGQEQKEVSGRGLSQGHTQNIQDRVLLLHRRPPLPQAPPPLPPESWLCRCHHETTTHSVLTSLHHSYTFNTSGWSFWISWAEVLCHTLAVCSWRAHLQSLNLYIYIKIEDLYKIYIKEISLKEI